MLKQYEGKSIEEVEDKEDRRILEIVRRLDKEYAFGHEQLHGNLGNALKIENWCITNFGDKEKRDRKLPSRASNDREEKKLANALMNLRKMLKQYEGKSIEEVEDEEDRKVLEVLRRLDEEYNPRKSKEQDLKEAKKRRDEAEAQNDEARKLQQEVSVELKKRGKKHEEQ